MLIQSPGSHPTQIRGAAGAGFNIAPWEPMPVSKALEYPPSSHLGPLLGLAKAKFHTPSLPVAHLWHS